MPSYFRSFLSNRYSGKTELYYQRYKEVARRITNLPKVPHPEDIKRLKTKKFNIRRHAPSARKYHYGYGDPIDDWRVGDNVPIVERRRMELSSDTQLMEMELNPGNEFSHMIWMEEVPGQPAVEHNRPMPNGSKLGRIKPIIKRRGRPKKSEGEQLANFDNFVFTKSLRNSNKEYKLSSSEEPTTPPLTGVSSQQEISPTSNANP